MSQNFNANNFVVFDFQKTAAWGRGRMNLHFFLQGTKDGLSKHSLTLWIY